jgi:hypothetical protein
VIEKADCLAMIAFTIPSLWTDTHTSLVFTRGDGEGKPLHNRAGRIRILDRNLEGTAFDVGAIGPSNRHDVLTTHARLIRAHVRPAVQAMSDTLEFFPMLTRLHCLRWVGRGWHGRLDPALASQTVRHQFSVRHHSTTNETHGT